MSNGGFTTLGSAGMVVLIVYIVNLSFRRQVMGWGRYLLLGDLGQQLDLADQKAELDQIRREMQRSRGPMPDVNGRLARLEAENDELRLYLAAVVRLLKNKGVVSATEARRMVETLDAEDGAADGKYTGPMG